MTHALRPATPRLAVPCSVFRVLCSVFLSVSLSAAATPAAADTPPSVWDRARDPSTADTYRIHLEVQRRLAQIEPRDFGFSGTHESQKDTVRAMLERLHADRLLVAGE